MNNAQSLAIQIEALLFALGKPLSRAELPKMLGASSEEIDEAITFLLERDTKEWRGIILADDGRQVELRAAAKAAARIEQVRREEFSRDLGRAGAEVLAILIYRGPSTRAQIDFIRGVNSSQALRTLAIRGLVRKTMGSSQRGVVYELTTDALGSLGIVYSAEAPEYETIRDRLQQLKESRGN